MISTGLSDLLGTPRVARFLFVGPVAHVLLDGVLDDVRNAIFEIVRARAALRNERRASVSR